MIDLNQSPDVAPDKDNLGGGYQPWDTGIYDCVVDMAYLDESSGGAGCLVLAMSSGDKTIKENIYFSSGKEKGQLTYFINKDGQKQNLPGFTLALGLCETVLGKTLAQAAEAAVKKVVPVYDYDAGGEVPTEKSHVLVELIGKTAKVAIIRQTVNKRAKNAAGKYEPTNEKRDENVISQFFYPDTGMTVNEKASGMTEADFINLWDEKNTGVTRDRFKPVQGADANSGSFGSNAGNAGGAAGGTTPSIFGGGS